MYSVNLASVLELAHLLQVVLTVHVAVVVPALEIAVVQTTTTVKLNRHASAEKD